MNIPGFTAEKSVYNTKGNYKTTQVHYGVNGAIYPALHWASPWSPRLPWKVEGYLATLFCCRACANDCFRVCPDRSCVDYCMTTTCNPKCDSYKYGGCAKLLGL